MSNSENWYKQIILTEWYMVFVYVYSGDNNPCDRLKLTQKDENLLIAIIVVSTTVKRGLDDQNNHDRHE